MRTVSFLKSIPDFKAQFLPESVPLQDTVHITNRARTRLFKSTILPMENYTASSSDLLTLVNFCTKDKHMLCTNDSNLSDKMKFGTSMKVCHPRIWKLLDKHVPGNEGTQMYLKIMFLLIQAFLSTNLSVLQRVHCIFYSISFLRMWQLWLKSNKKQHSEGKNFITVNMNQTIIVIKRGDTKL